jgi:hypothetical protein
MSEFTELLSEFKTLKQKIFGNDMFVAVNNDEDTKRYNQLLGFFYPQFRTSDWESPL